MTVDVQTHPGVPKVPHLAEPALGEGGRGLGAVTPPFGMIWDFLAVGQVAVGVVAEYGAGQLGEDLLQFGVLPR
jgi:hypothetical protein